MKTKSIRARVLNAGIANAPILCLDDALSFWGGFNPVDGLILDRAHPQVGETVKGKILLMPESRGSSGTPGGVAESIRLGTGPVAIVLGKADVNITIGAMVADRLYGTATPVLAVSSEDFATIRSCDRAKIARDGLIAARGSLSIKG